MRPTSRSPSWSGCGGRRISQVQLVPERYKATSNRIFEFAEKGMGTPQIRKIEAFAEPVIDRLEKLNGLGPIAMIAPEAGETRGGAQFERFFSALAGKR